MKYMINKIEIEQEENGWVLTYWDEYEETGLPYTRKRVFGYDDESDPELNKLKALERLYWEINEQIGVPHSKHNKYNINIDIVWPLNN